MIDPEKADSEMGYEPSKVLPDGTRIYIWPAGGGSTAMRQTIYHPSGEIETSIVDDWRNLRINQIELPPPALPAAAAELPSKIERGKTTPFFLACLPAAILVLYGLSQLVVGNMGIHHHWGGIWAFVITAFSIGTGVYLPISIGAFFGAKDVLGWNWFWSALFSFPGVVFMIACWIGEAPFSVWSWIRRRK